MVEKFIRAYNTKQRFLGGSPKTLLPLGTMNLLYPDDGFLAALDAVVGPTVRFG